MSTLDDDIKDGTPWHGARTPFKYVFVGIDQHGALTSTYEERIWLWLSWLKKRKRTWEIFEGKPILRTKPFEGFFVVT